MTRSITRFTAGTVALVAALATVLTMFSPAHAATTFTPTISGNGQANFVGNNVNITAIQAGQTMTCSTFDAAGRIVNSGVSRPYGANGAVKESVTISGCTNPIAGPVTVTPIEWWGVTATGDPTGTVWPARLSGLKFSVTAAGCAFDVSGNVSGTFDTATQVFAPVSAASGVKITSTPVGFLCPILGIARGLDIEVGGTWTNTPPAGSGPLTLVNP